MENEEIEVICGKCGCHVYEFLAKEVEVIECIHPDGEEITGTIYLCPNCAEPPE